MGQRYHVQNGSIFIFSQAVTNQMFQQGLLPNQGLGKDNKGKIDPVVSDSRPSRAGLGYF